MGPPTDAGLVPDPETERWQPAIAAAWARHGRWDRVSEVLASAPGAGVAINCALSEVCAAAGDVTGAVRRARRAVELTEQGSGPERRWHRRVSAAATLVRVGAPDDAVGLVLGWDRPPAAPRTRPTEHALGLLVLANALVDVGRPGDAQRLVDATLVLAGQLSGRGWQDDVLSAAAVTFAELGSMARAADLISAIDDPWSATEAHVGMARAALRAGALRTAERAASSALEAANDVSFRDWRAEASANAVVAATEVGAVDEADRGLELIVDPVWRAEALLQTAASVGDAWTRVEEARTLAASVGYGWWVGCGRSVARIVTVHLRSGDLDGAGVWFTALRHPRLAASVLWQVTDELRRLPDVRDARGVRSSLVAAADRLRSEPAAVAAALELAVDHAPTHRSSADSQGGSIEGSAL